jgi:hypothetical protein
MHTLEIPSKKIFKEFPSQLQELNKKQFLYFTYLFLQLLEKNITINDFKVLLVSNLLNIKKTTNWHLLTDEKKEEIYNNLSNIADNMNTFLDYTGTNCTIRTSFTKNLIPNIGKYYGPADVLSDCNAFEYKEAHAAFQQFISTQNVEYLDRLIAVLYRKKRKFLPLLQRLQNFDGQIRERFTPKTNPKLIEKRIKHFSKLSFHVKYAVFLIYQSCEEFLRDGEIEIDGNPINLSELYKNDDNSSDTGIGLMGMFFELAESKVFGELQNVMNTNIYDIFTRVYQLVRISENMKKQYKQNDSN